MWRRAGKSFARLTFGIVVAAALLIAIPTSARSEVIAPAGGYGFGDGAAMEWMAIGDVNRELDAVSKTGASWLRVLIDWSRVEPTKGRYDWSYVDGVVNAATAHNLKVLGVIAYTASWARPPGTYFTYPPLNAADYGDFAAVVVRRYSDRVSDWELWNEPNLPQFFGYLIDNNPVRYVALLQAATPRSRRCSPTAPCWPPG